MNEFGKRIQLTEVARKMWTCPDCGREFERRNQSHSCRIYPLERHFSGKEALKKLFDSLCLKTERKIGAFQVESLECCIHFVSTFTFAAVKVLKDKLRIDFALSGLVKNKRLIRTVRLSEKRFLYDLEIKKAEEIDAELLNWMEEAHRVKRSRLKVPE